MDGRRRLAEPLTDRARPRTAAVASPLWRRPWDRLGRTSIARIVLRVVALPERRRMPKGMGVATATGFRISSIALIGEHHLTREDILSAAGITPHTSLLFLDAGEVRSRLRANPWIAEATVLKLYPGRLHVAITERKAFALWQKD